MKRIRSEFVHAYKTYSFGYCEYAEYEEGDNLSEIYAQGFLPYSGTPDIQKVLYLARSARLRLKTFKLNSENRRIARRFDGALERVVTPIDHFDYTKKEFIRFCTEYFAQRHGPNVMPEKRLLTIVKSGFPIDVITYVHDGTTVGHALEVGDAGMGHYWYSFYDLEYAYKSLGLWIMIDSVREAKKSGKDYYYLGTVYGEKALYKTNFDNLEWWNGNKWVQNTKLLRKISRHDEHKVVDAVDQWKEGKKLF